MFLHCWIEGEFLSSGEVRIGMKLPPFLLLAPGDLLELALDLAGSRERSAIHLFERLVRSIEDETARQPNGNADGPAFQFDCKSLHAHSISPGEQSGTLTYGPRGCPVV
jgi:hypothetical protein